MGRRELSAADIYCKFAAQLDEDGFRLYHAAQQITGFQPYNAFPYEDNRGAFEAADGHTLLRYPRHYTKEQVSVRTTDDAAVSVMAYIMAEPLCRQPALPSPYYYHAIQQGFEANGLPVESLEEAWNRTIDEVWSGKTDKPKNRKVDRNKNPER